MYRILIKSAIAFFICSVFSLSKLSAGIVTFSDSLIAQQIVANSTCAAKEDLFSPSSGLPLGPSYKTVNNLVSLSYTSTGAKHINEAFTLSLDIEVIYDKVQDYGTGRSTVTTQMVPVTLQINYDPVTGNIYKDKDIYFAKYAHRASVKIVNISFQTNSSTLTINDIQDRLKLHTILEIDRYDVFSTSAMPKSTLSHSYNSNTNELKINWGDAAGAEGYDLEWTYVNDYSGELNGTAPATKAKSDLTYSFMHNSTRVRLPKVNEYSIPLIYEHGYILYRIRAIGKAGVNFKESIFSEWSAPDFGDNVETFDYTYSTIYEVSSHESDGKNWQYTVSFAEEGKNKGLISYYDGTMRNRQKVTKVSTDKSAIVGETVFDANGRPAIEVLPVPISINKFQYYPKFNKNLNGPSGEAYSYKDINVQAPNSCIPSAGQMNTNSGASQYYSSSTVPDRTKQQAYVPDAGKYPFSQTQYTLDNTGRIRAKSAPGPDHQLNTSHATKYYYGTPFQEELDLLFGNEVGNSNRYKKNIVVDANGQVSVSYLDPKGNVIATALAGNTPSNVQSLSSSGNTIQVDLLETNESSHDGYSLVSTSTLVVTSSGNHTFNYSMTGNKITESCLNICYTCKYDLSIILTDACGNTVHTVNQTIGSLDLINTTCSTLTAPNLSALSFVKSLNVGTYTITKTLTVNEASINAYVDATMIASTNSCLTSKDTYFEQELQRIDIKDCSDNCTECKEQLGPYSRYSDPTKENYLTSSQYQILLAQCGTATCPSTDNIPKDPYIDQCEMAYIAMLQDVSPGGQYGGFLDSLTGVIDPSYYPVSVFNTSTTNYKPDNNWKKPLSAYNNEDGSPSYIVIIDNKPDADMSKALKTPEGEIVVAPQYLTDVSDFLDAWKPSWAKSLVYYHPEYKLYNWCNSNSLSNKFDQEMANTKTFSEAISKGFIDISSLNTTTITGCSLSIYKPLINEDPYFMTGGQGADQICSMQKEMNNYSIYIDRLNNNNKIYYSIFDMAVIGANCGAKNNSDLSQLTSCLSAHIFGNTILTKDKEWELYRGFYLALKQRLQDEKKHQYAIQNGCYNHCLENVEFNFAENNFYSAYFSQNQPCSRVNINYFKDKKPRFASINQIIKEKVYYGKYSNDVWKTFDQVKKNALDEAKKCGKCPKTYLWEGFLNEIASKGKLLSTETINNYSSFILDIHNSISNLNNYNNNNINWTPVYYSSTELKAKFYSTSDSNLCTVNLNIENTNETIDWTTVTNLVDFESIHYTGGGNLVNEPYEFYIYAITNTGKKIKLKGNTSCLTLDCDQFVNPKCTLTPEAKDVKNLLNYMLADQSLTTTHLLSGGNYNNLLTPTIKNILKGASNGTIKWDVTYLSSCNVQQSKTLAASLIEVDANGNQINSFWGFLFDIYSDDNYCFSDISTIVDIVLGPPNNSNPEWCLMVCRSKSGEIFQMGVTGGWITAYPYDNYSWLECGDPDQNCLTSDMTLGNTRRNDLEVFLSALTKDYKITTTTSYDIENYSAFSSDLKTGIPGTARKWKCTTTPTNGVLTAVFEGASPSCSLTLTAPATRFNFNDILDFENLQAKPSGIENALSNDFVIDAITKFGTKVQLQGNISCMQLANCKACGQDVLEYEYGNYVDACNDYKCGPLPLSPTVPLVNTCTQYLVNATRRTALDKYKEYINTQRKNKKQEYIQKCLNSLTETYNMTFVQKELHYTLYYYDQANNLVKTVPPVGFSKNANLQAVKLHRINSSNPPSYPSHTFKTTYKYNSLNQLVWQNTPDANTTTFYYDALGRMVVSQNTKQLPAGKYSYTLYDALGRIKEVGEIASAGSPIVSNNLLNTGYIDGWLSATGKTKTQITRTYYDESLAGVNAFFDGGQQNLRSRVASVTYQETDGSNYDFGSHYSYDIHGNVHTLIQENKSLNFLGHDRKKIEYEYDLISGKVNKVIYQRDHADQFMHKYSYDADNRIVQLETSQDGIIWDKDSKYFYYKHGPLARTEIGEHKVQGIDYAYTIQGWLKGLNSGTLSATNDMGNDGTGTSNAYSFTNSNNITVNLHENIARDAFGFTLGYFSGDYLSATPSTTTFEASLSGSSFNTASPNLYNGNIRHMVTAIGKLMPSGQPLGTAYKYDQLNRLVSMDVYNNINLTTNQWQTGAAIPDFYTNYTYDANGNIRALQRKGTTQASNSLDMDNLTYGYYPNTNKLKYVADAVTSTNYTTDIDNQATDNYNYDAIGNLIQDKAEEIMSIEWSVYGKVKKIIRNIGSLKPDLEFFYGPDGNRVAKVVKNGSDPTNWTYTYYVRDAQGNVMATYSRKLEKAREVLQTDYPALFSALKQELGTTAYRNFITTTYCGEQWYSTKVRDKIISTNNTTNILSNYPGSFYAEVDATVRTNVLNNIGDDDLAAAFLRQQPEVVLTHYFQQSGINVIQLLQTLVCQDANQFLLLLNGQDPNVISMLHQQIFGYIMGDIMQMISNLAGYNCSDLATEILNYSSTYNTGHYMLINVCKQYSSSQLYNELIWQYGGNFSAIRSYLVGQPSIISVLYLDDPNNINSVVLLMSNTDKLNIVAQYDPCNMSTYAVNLSEALVTDVLKDNYSVKNFIGDVYTHVGSTIYKNMMIAVYGLIGDLKEKLLLDELHVYGSSRLGTKEAKKELVVKDYDGTVNLQTGLCVPLVVYNTVEAPTMTLNSNIYLTRFIGSKRYELSNHLGNVLAVITDKKVSVPNAGASTIAYYDADVITATDYYPFGSPMPERSYSANNIKYRYGFNGKENDNEVLGEGRWQDYGLRMYRPDLGRFFSVDPLASYFPFYTPYQFAGNDIIRNIDLDGGEPKEVGKEPMEQGKDDKGSNWVWNNNQWEPAAQQVEVTGLQVPGARNKTPADATTVNQDTRTLPASPQGIGLYIYRSDGQNPRGAKPKHSILIAAEALWNIFFGVDKGVLSKKYEKPGPKDFKGDGRNDKMRERGDMMTEEQATYEKPSNTTDKPALFNPNAQNINDSTRVSKTPHGGYETVSDSSVQNPFDPSSRNFPGQSRKPRPSTQDEIDQYNNVIKNNKN